MIKKFYPNEYVSSIFHINYDRLMKMGIDRLIFDIDNTIEPFDIPIPSSKDLALFNQLDNEGFKICLVSNNSKERVEKFNEPLNLPYVYRAKKPSKYGILKAMSSIGASINNCALIGDQVFTDIYLSNRMGIYSVLVKPVSQRDELSVRIKRGVEKAVIKSYIKYRNSQQPAQ